jgi:hypothetical protein
VNQVPFCPSAKIEKCRIAFSVTPRQSSTLSEVNEYCKEGARLGALVAPYRHARLSAIKLAGDLNAITKPDATIEELREDDLIDLQALSCSAMTLILAPF